MKLPQLWTAFVIVSIASMASVSACTKSTYDPSRERQQAQAFAMRLNELLRKESWAEISSLMDPDPHCTSRDCIVRKLTADSDCEKVSAGRIKLAATALEMFEAGDGFTVAASTSGSNSSCRFKVEVNRTEGTGPYYLPLPPSAR